MRFAAISPAVHHQRTLHFEPALRRVDPGGSSSAAHLRPLRGISQPDLALKSAVPPPKPTNTKPQLRVVRSKSDSSLTRKWHVEESDLSERPRDFPTLRTSRTVRSGTPAHVISNRLSDCLQSRSIKTRFSKSEGNNMAKCRNTSFCKFTIRLYAAGGGEAAAGEEGAGGTGILVEVQRLCGDYVSFMKDCRALLNAAEGKAIEECSDSHDDQPLYLRLPVSEMAFVKTVSLPPVTHEEEAESLNVTSELLSSRQSDSNMLGMESLAIQTDPVKTLKSTAMLASRRILCPTDVGNVSFNMHNYVMSLLIYGNEDAASSEDEPEDTTTTITALEDHSSKLRNLAMSSLHNALSLFASERLLLPAISDNEEWYASVLIPKLLHDLRSAEHNPHDACYASRCLSTLAECSGEFASRMNEGGAVDILKTAEEVGSREFALLARDAGSCRQKMLSCCV